MKKVICLAFVTMLALFSYAAYQYFLFNDGKLHIVFCDVGQGDAIFITTPNKKHMLVDSGPDKRVIDCLARHMPFWERTIDVALLTHPHADHFAGYYYLVDRYSLHLFSTELLINKAAGFKELMHSIDKHTIPKHIVHTGDRWRVGEVTVTIAGPTKEFELSKNPDGIISNSAESASLVTSVTYGNFQALLTGDAPVDEMEQIVDEGMGQVSVLQIPHHGSSTGLDEHVLAVLQPKLAVISVGAKNRYGHPTKYTLDLLQDKGIKILRTDQVGDVEIVTDGKTFESH